MILQPKKREMEKKNTTPERFELSRGNPMYLAGTRLNHSAKASLYARCNLTGIFIRKQTEAKGNFRFHRSIIQTIYAHMVIESCTLSNNLIPPSMFTDALYHNSICVSDQ